MSGLYVLFKMSKPNFSIENFEVLKNDLKKPFKYHRIHKSIFKEVISLISVYICTLNVVGVIVQKSLLCKQGIITSVMVENKIETGLVATRH